MAVRTRYQVTHLFDFSGGWNPREAWSELAENESPDMLNVTLDERGGVMKRLGLAKLNGADQIVNTGNIQSLHYSAAIDRHIAQVGASLYVSSDGGATWGAAIKTFTTSARCHMVDFLGKVVVIHPADNCWHYDGTTFTGPIANSPDGTCITVWANALLSIGDPANPSRVTRSDLGAITWPASPVTNDIRAKDDKPLTAIGGGAGMDVLGRDGLLVFKEDSHYRIHDIAALAYTVADYQYGASGPMAITTNAGLTCAISKKGIIQMRGDGSSPELVSLKIDPLFRTTQLTYSAASTMVATNFRDRMVFSLPWDGSSTNNMALEYHPIDGWFAPHDFGLSAATVYTKNTSKLHGGKVGTAAASYGYLLDVFSGGNDDGSAITSRFQTHWIEPSIDGACRFRRLIVNGRGSFTLYVKRNFTPGAGLAFPIAITGTGALWNGTTWGGAEWAGGLSQDYDAIYSLGVGRSISFEVQESSTTTGTAQPLLDVGSSDTVGAWSLYGLSLDSVPLGRS